MYYRDDFIRQCYNEGLIDGKRVKYDGCSNNPLPMAKEFYTDDKWEYIGSSFTTFHDGVENNWGKEYHFFIHKP